jgi:hypothetical protein
MSTSRRGITSPLFGGKAYAKMERAGIDSLDRSHVVRWWEAAFTRIHGRSPTNATEFALWRFHRLTDRGADA